MKRRSKKRQAEIDALPAVRSISLDRTPRPPDDESFREFVRRLPCVVCLRHTLGGDPCHLHARRRFGDWVDVDGCLSGNIFPACRHHHSEQHTLGVESFGAVHSVNLAASCLVIGRAYVLCWSTEGLAAAALRKRGYSLTDAELQLVYDGELPY